MTTNNNAWMEVFSGEAFEAEVVKGLLEANGIRCIMEDHTMSALTSHYNGIGGDVAVSLPSLSRSEMGSEVS